MVLQHRLFAELEQRRDRFGGLLICEHPPVLTIGREGSHDDVLVDTGGLRSLMIDVRRVARGGGCLLHLPGQLAVYPVVPLSRLGLRVAEYRSLLEDSLIAVCDELRISARRQDDQPGVWCRLGRPGYVAAAVRSGIAHHGLFVNVNPDLTLMRTVQSCRAGERITSLSAQRERPIAMHAVRESLVRNLSARLGYRHYHVHTGHPLLRRAKKTVYDYA